jgi:hypothetical protein
MTLREKLAADGSEDAIVESAVLIAAYERGRKGFKMNDAVFIARCETLAAMDNEQFEKERRSVVFEFEKEKE